MQTAFLIGIGAGLASAILYASAWTGTVLGLFVLFFLSPMPVAIAGLGWGWASGVIAALAGAVAVIASGGPRSGIVYLVAIGAPAAVFSYLALLNRPADVEGEVEWYPIGRIVAWASLWAALISTAGLLSFGTDADSVRATWLELLNKAWIADDVGPGGTKITPEQKASIAALLAVVQPWAIATAWFTVAMLNLWGAGQVTARSGRLARPWPDLSNFSLPPGMALAFGASVLGMLPSDMMGLVASCFASALLFAFMLVGLGLLHRLTRGYSIRPFLLSMVYASLLFLPPFSNLLVALLGLAEPFLRGRQPPGPQPSGGGAA